MSTNASIHGYELPCDVDEEQLDIEFSRLCEGEHDDLFAQPEFEQHSARPSLGATSPNGIELKPESHWNFKEFVRGSNDLKTEMLRICYEHQSNKMHKEWIRACNTRRDVPPWSWLRSESPRWIREAETQKYISDHGLSAASVVLMGIVDLVDLVTNSTHGTYGSGASNSFRYAQVETMIHYATESQNFIDVLEELYNATEPGRVLRYQELPTQLTSTMEAQIARREIEMEAQNARARVAEEELARQQVGNKEFILMKAEEDELARKKAEVERTMKDRRKAGLENAVRKLNIGSVQRWLKACDDTNCQADPAYDVGFIRELISLTEGVRHSNRQAEQKASVLAELTTQLEEIQMMAA
jgi:hypothetical protein